MLSLLGASALQGHKSKEEILPGEKKKRNPKSGSQKVYKRSKAPPKPGMSIQGKHPKTAVSQFLERYWNRALTKADILYSSRDLENGRVIAILKVPCFNSEQYFGEAQSKEEAEKHAAAAFLQDSDVQDALENLAPSMGAVRS